MRDTLVRESATRILEVNPALTYAEIARLLGVSRERIRQVAGGRRRHPRVCKVCGQSIHLRRNGVTQTAYRLQYCGTCWVAAKERRRNGHHEDFTCETCGKTFRRTAGVVKRMEKRGHKIRWCSRRCQGIWLGANYGYSGAEGERDSQVMSR